MSKTKKKKKNQKQNNRTIVKLKLVWFNIWLFFYSIIHLCWYTSWETIDKVENYAKKLGFIIDLQFPLEGGYEMRIYRKIK